MVLVTSNKPRQLLCVSYIQKVTPAELQAAQHDIATLLADLPAEFCLLADLTHLEQMDPECATEIGRTMEMLSKHKVGLIIRVVPDASKDIGLNILTAFHYSYRPKVINSRNLAEAMERLAAWK